MLRRQSALGEFEETHAGEGATGRKLELASGHDGYEPNKRIDKIKRFPIA
jgi:hypothetical protein